MSPGQITGFYKTANPCADCVDGWCQMNCGPVELDPDRLREDRDERQRLAKEYDE